jgi:heptosyltransferase-3
MRQESKNILLIQLGDIGDVVLSIPAFLTVKKNYPEANIVIAVREKAKELVQYLDGVHDVISINQDARSFFDEIRYQRAFFSRARGYHFDLAFDFRTGTRGAVLAFLSGARERVSFLDHDSFWRNKLFTTLYPIDYHLPQYVADYYLSLPLAYGLKEHKSPPVIQITSSMEERAKEILDQEKICPAKPVIAIQPFSLWRYKEWDIEKYIQLIQRIIIEYGFTIVLTGSRDEYGRMQMIVDEFRETGHPVRNLAGKTTLAELAAILKLCRLLIGSDSAGMHIAAAVETPTVIIFGPSSPESWAPRGDMHTIVQKEMSCVPCRQKGCDGGGISRCLDELEVNEVFSVIRSHLEKKHEG